MGKEWKMKRETYELLKKLDEIKQKSVLQNYAIFLSIFSIKDYMVLGKRKKLANRVETH